MQVPHIAGFLTEASAPRLTRHPAFALPLGFGQIPPETHFTKRPGGRQEAQPPTA